MCRPHLRVVYSHVCCCAALEEANGRHSSEPFARPLSEICAATVNGLLLSRSPALDLQQSVIDKMVAALLHRELRVPPWPRHAGCWACGVPRSVRIVYCLSCSPLCRFGTRKVLLERCALEQ